MLTTFDWCVVLFLSMGIPSMYLIFLIGYSIQMGIKNRRWRKLEHKKDLERLYEDCLKRIERL